MQGEQPTPPSALTLGTLWERYQQEASAYRQLGERTRKQRNSHARLLLAALGQKKRVEHLTLADVEQYVALRRRGTEWPDGRITAPVRARAIASELHVLRTMLLWATRVRQSDGSWLLRDYPLRGLKLPREEDVRRPIASHERFLKLREVIGTLAETAPQKRGRERWVRIGLALILAEATGARIGAIRGLRWSDITYGPPRVRWRAEFDKKGRERLVPIPESLVQELRRFQVQLGGIGDGWLFPCADGSGPWPREIFGEQLLVAEQKAGLEHLKGGAWHSFRRKWATERKDLPLVDVKATGGWRDTNTLLTCYQQTDEASMLRVMEAPRKLRSVG